DRMNQLGFLLQLQPEIGQLVAVERVAVVADELLRVQVRVGGERDRPREVRQLGALLRLSKVVAYPSRARPGDQSHQAQGHRVADGRRGLHLDAEVQDTAASREGRTQRVLERGARVQ